LGRLTTWLVDHDEIGPVRILEERGEPARRLVRLIVALDPNLPMRYGGLEISSESLTRLVQEAINDSGGNKAKSALEGLFELDMLGVYPPFADLNARWRRAMGVFREAVPSYPPVDVAYHEVANDGRPLTLLGLPRRPRCVGADRSESGRPDSVSRALVQKPDGAPSERRS
jgi:hypothetical protein